MTGRTLPHSMMMMIPEPWSGDPDMNPAKRAFYEYHSCLMEPWDGPASIAFTDGLRAGAVLDRNGLRPSRYSVTTGGQVILASEVGVLDVPPQQVLRKGRLQPGRMFLVDAVEGRIISDGELKRNVSVARPYRKWLRENLVPLDFCPQGPRPPSLGRDQLRRQQHLFGYTNEDLRLLIAPMASDGHEAVGSMGTDTPLAPLSDRPQLLYNYFKQLFAQVTNPPVDAIREALIMSLDNPPGIGREPVGSRAPVGSPDQGGLSHPGRRADGEVAPARRRWSRRVPDHRSARLYEGPGRESGAGHGPALPRGRSGGLVGQRHPGPLGSGRRPRRGSDSGPAGGFGAFTTT